MGVHLLRFVLHFPCCGCETEGGWCQSGGKARARHRRCELADLMATVSFACRREESVEGRLWRFARRKSSRTICGGGGGVFCHCLYDGVGSEDLSEPETCWAHCFASPQYEVFPGFFEQSGGGGIVPKTSCSNLMSTRDFAASLHGGIFLQKCAADSSVKSVTAIGMIPDCCASTAAVAPTASGEALCLSTVAPLFSISCATRGFFLAVGMRQREQAAGHGAALRG